MKNIRIVINRLWQEGEDIPKYKEHKQTLGVIQVLNENGGIMLQGYSLELANKDNQKNISRIPAGDYEVITRWSPKFKKHFHILDVENRSWILIHIGNFAAKSQLIGKVKK